MKLDRNYILGRLKALGMTQRELADKVGVTESMISHVLSGKADLNTRRIGFLCEALECQPNDVYEIGERSEVSR